MRPPPISILGQPNPVHIPTSHLLEIHPNIINPSTPRSPQWSPSLRFPHQHPIYPLSSPIRATCPAHLILLDFITRTILGEVYKSFTHNALLVLKVPRFATRKLGNVLKTKTHQCIHFVQKPTFKQVWGLLFKDMVTGRENEHCFFPDTRQPTVSTVQDSL